MGQLHMFGMETQYEELTNLGEPLLNLKKKIDWEIFRKPIETAIRKDYSKGGRPPYDVLLMFKITILQQWYGSSDMEIQLLITDRLSFLRFLDMEVGEKVPDKNM